jgi:hypothetical protein
MVERRMRDAILALGSVWYSAWLEAGQPNLDNLTVQELSRRERRILEEEKRRIELGEAKGRKHAG